MISLFKKNIKSEKCIEQSFFKAIIILGIIGCVTSCLFDVVILKRTDTSVQVIFLLTQIMLLTLYAINRVNFDVVTTGGILMMGIMFTYRGLVLNEFNEITCTLLITVGFISALVSKPKTGWILKSLLLFALVAVLFKNYNTMSTLTLVRHAIPYIVIYCVVTICSGLLKSRYEANQERLKEMVDLLNAKNKKINDQHAMLKKNFSQLADLNGNLEHIINEKTCRISEMNKQLAEIAYANAHTIRGPLARILGLINLARLEPHKNSFYIGKINEQALDMDETLLIVTKQIEVNIYK
jgi:hypothetical protein